MKRFLDKASFERHYEGIIRRMIMDPESQVGKLLADTREHLLSAGFSNVSVYWEDSDKRGNATGNFRKREKVENDPSWNAYILAER